MNTPGRASRLSLLQAAYVVARRDFTAILGSRAFIFFLLGPLFPLVIFIAAGVLGREVASEVAQPEIGVAMTAQDGRAMLEAYERLEPSIGGTLPHLVELEILKSGEAYDAAAILEAKQGNLAGVVTGTPAAPSLTATKERLDRWQHPLSLVAAEATGQGPQTYPDVALATVNTSGQQAKVGRTATAQAGQTVLFLLIMLLAGMVLSNLVEEKGNKVIEILAAAIPMDAVFLGKLFAMLGVSFVGILVWGGTGGGLMLLAGGALPNLPVPAVGWPLFFAFGTAYFAMGYLLLGSIFLAVGSMAATVREVQTLNMPVTMMQLVVFFFATYALTKQGSPIELAAIIFPLSSPFSMLARAAQDEAIWPHFAAMAWQALWVAIFIRTGANLFRKRVMKSGPQGAKKTARRRWLPVTLFTAGPK